LQAKIRYRLKSPARESTLVVVSTVPQSSVLVVEDEPAIAESIAYALGKADLRTRQAGTLERARAELAHQTDLLLLDLMLPDGSGFDLIAEVTARAGARPAIIVLSSRDAEADRVRALEMGADDYVVKPFSPREVTARVKAVLRRASTTERSEPLLRLSAETRRATFGQHELELTRVEFELLALLMSKPGHVFSRASIIDSVWGPGFALSDRTIDSHIKALRKEIARAGGPPASIETVRGIGYRTSSEHDA
jgi:two-component system catabolic regulation response regulator CreB